MSFLTSNRIFFLLGLCYAALSVYFLQTNQSYFTLFPIGLLGVYFAFFYSKVTFIALAFFVPLSVNIEEWTQGVGLFLPTEPILFGFLLLALFRMLKEGYDFGAWNNPIIIALLSFIAWIAITIIPSSSPFVSFKFLIAKLWFLVPILFFGIPLFQDRKNIIRFLWLFVIGMTLVMSYTLFVHASYGFGEKEGHWVMFPFFKDHTIYGALVAFVLPIIVGLYRSKKHSPILQAILLLFIVINLIALYFSYTRAAWLSVMAAVGVLGLIYFNIKFKWIALSTLTLIGTLIISWDAIQMALAKNKYEHTTEEFGERLQSATNVTTDASNLERINRWSCAWEMFKERPVFGFGPGTYAFEYARFQEPENLTIISTNFGDMGNAHSEYLGALAEMGLLGLLLFLAIVATIFHQGITLYLKWPSEDHEMRVLLLAMIMALVTYFVHAFLNNYLDTDKAAFPIFSFAIAFVALKQVKHQSVSIPKI